MKNYKIKIWRDKYFVVKCGICHVLLNFNSNLITSPFNYGEIDFVEFMFFL